MRKFLLVHEKAPGDILAMTALVRDLALTHPNHVIDVHTNFPELWKHNPHIQPISDLVDIETIKFDYGPYLNQVASRNKHFLTAFYEDFENQTGIHVPLLYPRPDYHLGPDKPMVEGRYWVILSGGKTDFETKHWVYKRHQQVVNILRGFGLRFVQLGAVGKAGDVYHIHPRLENTVCLINQTNIRQMAAIIANAEGVICPITASMHFAAAFQKPCVVLGGGREEWWWYGYVPGLGNFGQELREEIRVPHRVLHTLGLLDCCKRQGCWRSKLWPHPEKGHCTKLVNVRGQDVPSCMDMITVNHVVEAVMSYYKDGTLPPIGQSKDIVFVGEQPYFAEDAPKQVPESALETALTPPPTQSE